MSILSHKTPHIWKCELYDKTADSFYILTCNVPLVIH